MPAVTPPSAQRIRVREGRLQDLKQVKQFTHDTFSWGDYLPGAWESWVHSKRGILLVAEIGRVIVGTVHVRYLENKEAWLEGVRVRHDFRQRGIASILIQAAHDHARTSKCHVIRLETGAQNHPAQRAFEKFGYHRIGSYSVYKGNAASGTHSTAKRAKLSNIDTCWDLWQHSTIRRSIAGVVPAPYGWRWWELTRKRLSDDIRAGRVWLNSEAFCTIRPDEDGLDLTLLVGTKRAATSLLRSVTQLASQETKPHVFWIAPSTPRSSEWAAAADYVFDDDGLLIYACLL